MTTVHLHIAYHQLFLSINYEIYCLNYLDYTAIVIVS